MFFPTSGRMHFEVITLSTELPPIEVLREMIFYETNIRLSEPIQNLIDVYHENEAAVA
jgi:16S rRNA C1402 (ribose-2'-O) methylase RsmI